MHNHNEKMSQITKVLFIGDPHFKINNNNITDVFIEECEKILKQLHDDNGDKVLCVIAGDILDTHERIHQTPYNKALKFIDNLRKITKVYILVGNHDYENNQQFLTDKHWMNPLKKWDNVFIAEQVLEYQNMIFVPYVPPGRFLEALDTYEGGDWRDAKCIFAHQEIRGCTLGTLKSEHGDKWPLHYPLVVSGHIHKAHRPQKNVIYPGSVIQHNFGEENNDTGLFLIDFSETEEEKKYQNIPITIPKMSTVNITCEEFDDFMKHLVLKPLQRIRVICTGNEEQFKRIKKTNTYNNTPIGVSVVFKTNKQFDDETSQKQLIFESFDEILFKKIKKTNLEIIFNKINNGDMLFNY